MVQSKTDVLRMIFIIKNNYFDTNIHNTFPKYLHPFSGFFSLSSTTALKNNPNYTRIPPFLWHSDGSYWGHGNVT